MRRKKQIGGLNLRESRKKSLARKTLLPLLYRTKKARKGFTVGGVKFKVKKYKIAPRNIKEMKYGAPHSYGVFAQKKILGHKFKRRVF